MSSSYADEVAPSPYHNDAVPKTAETLIRYAAVTGLKQSTKS